ncbi:hypothetical protein K1X76_10700 [bacterium]|nr:hypothetical protein [bacterium]
MMNNIKCFLVILVLFLSACSGKGTINVGNPDGSSVPSIKIGKLNSTTGRSAIVMPVEIFGGESELDQSALNIDINQDRAVEVLDLQQYYDANGKTVEFTLANLAHGDQLTFHVLKNGAEVAVYEGEVSVSSDSQATLQGGAAANVKGVFVVDEANDTCTTDGNPATDDFGLADATDRDDLCLEVDDTGNFSFLDLDDDHTEVITEMSGSSFKIRYQDYINAGINFLCSLTYSADGKSVTGQCKYVDGSTTHTCNLAYTKVGDDPQGTVMIDGLPHNCDNPDSFSDVRAIQ